MSEQRLARLSELEEGTANRFAVGDRELLVVRIEDAVYVLADRCSHQDISLSEGEVDVDECTIECPKHGAVFSLEDGAALTLPATRPAPTYATRIDDDGVVWIGVPT
jgi:3-phenylpropionate/trans-cinnamate dioxygenase ferredoxin subunit